MLNKSCIKINFKNQDERSNIENQFSENETGHFVLKKLQKADFH